VRGKQSEAVIGVAVIEDQQETREGISLLINRTDGFECRHLYGSMEAALEGIGVNPPRVVLVDIGLPGLDGIDGLRILQERYPRIAPVMLTVYKRRRPDLSGHVRGRLRIPAQEYAAGQVDGGHPGEGGAVMSPEVAIRVIELFRKAPVREAGWVGLSPQEIRLLKLFTEGHQNKTAAAQLGISVHTVSFHLRSIYEKLHVHTRSEAVARALRDGLIH